jgi:hypothetical protein
MLPNRVGVPNRMPSYWSSSRGSAIGAAWSSLAPALRASSSFMSSGTRLIVTSAPGTDPAPSATACAIVSTCPYML